MLNQILIKYMYGEKRYLNLFVPESFDSLQYDSTKRALIYKFNGFVTMAT